MPDDYSSNIQTAGTVAVGGSTAGEIETADDHDWFAVTLQAGRTYQFDLEGDRTDAGTLYNPYLRGLHDSDGVLLAGTTDDNSGPGLNSRVTFTATEGDTYYVSAGAHVGGEGTYTLRATDITDGISDDYTAGTDTAGTVAVGGSATGSIDSHDDRDWFAVTLDAGRLYRFDLEGTATDAGTLYDPYLRGIYDSAGNPIAGTTNDEGGEGKNARLTFMATEGGTYYVSAGAFRDGEGTYTLRTTDLTAKDRHTAGTDTAGTVAVGGSVTGEIDSGGDRDWFAVTLEAGRTYRFDLEGTATDAGTLSDPYLRGIYDSAGNPIAGTEDNNREEGRNALVTFTATEGDTYYVSAGAWSDGEGTYTLRVTDLTAEDAPTAGTDTAGTVAVGGSVSGEIGHGGDHDRFAVALEAGRTYRFDLEGSATDAGTLFDPYLRGIHDSNGNLIAGTDDNNQGEGRNALVTFTATEGGTHYVSAGAWRDFEGTYRLSVTDLTAEDAHTAGTDTAGTVAVGGSVSGEIGHGGDSDWFAVELEAGRTYRFDLEGSATDAGTLYDPYLRGIHDSAGNLIAGTEDNNQGEGRNALVTFTATEGGTHYVSAGAWRDFEGTYRLSVTDLTAEDAHTAGTDTAGTVAVGGSVSGEIGHGGDSDWFAVELEAGRTYRFDLEGSATDAGTLYDPYLRGIHDSAGNLIAGTDDNNRGEGRNALVTFTATEGGTHYVSAGAWRDFEGTYRLSVTDLTAEDAHTAGTDTAGTVAVGGSVTGEIGHGGDSDWFAVTLQAGRTYRFSLEGSATDAGTLYDPYLRGIHDSNGNLIAGTDDNNRGEGRNALVTFTATEDGTHYVSAGAWRDFEGTYRLSVTDLTAEDAHTAGTDTAGTVAVGGSVTGEIGHGGDHDWFAVELQAGRTYRFDLEGSATDAGTLYDPYLRGIHDSNGNLIAGTEDNNRGEGRNALVTFTAIEGGTHYVSAGAWRDQEGAYTLSVTDLTAKDAHTAGTDTAGTVAVGGSVTGEIGYGGDSDWFAVTLEAGRTYRFDLEGSATDAGTLYDPYLREIHDSNGNLIAGTDDNNRGQDRNALVTFTVTEDGTYYVSAGAWRDGEGTYRLSVTDLTDLPTEPRNELPAIRISDEEAHERDGVLRFRVTLDKASTETVTVRYATADVTATAGEDYEPAAGILEFAPGETEKWVEVVLIDDPVEDTGETFVLRLTDAVGARTEASEGVGTIRNSEHDTIVSEGETDFPAGTTTTGKVAVGGSATGEIGDGGDLDWFAVTLEASKTYRFDLEGWRTAAGTLLDPYLRGLFDADGTLIAGTTDDNAGPGLNSRLDFAAEEAGTYYVSAGARGNREGTYTLTVTDITGGVPDDYTGGTGTTGTVAVGGTATGEINDGEDLDWFAVTLVAGRTYRFDIEGRATDAGTLHDPYLRGIYDADGNLIDGTTADDGGTGGNSRLHFTAEAAGTYYISAGAWRDLEGTYTLRVTDATSSISDDYTTGTGTAGTVAVGGSATGEIDFHHDRDWFAVTLVAGKTYLFDLEGLLTDTWTRLDPYLRGIYDADGILIPGTTDNHGGHLWNARATFTAAEAGTYYVSAGANGASEGSYRLSVTEVTDGVPDDYTDGTGTTGTVAVGGSVTGEIEYDGDLDWFAVTLTANRTYRFDLEGRQTRAGTLADPTLQGIYDSAGNPIHGARDYNGGWNWNARLHFTAPGDGTYYVSAAGSPDREGTYRLAVSDVSSSISDDYTTGTGTAGRVSVGGSARGEIDFDHDRDWFAVTLAANKTYRFDLEGSQTSSGTLTDPYLRGIYDAAGSLIPGTADDNGGPRLNSRVDFAPTQAGTYYVSAGVVWNTGEGTYTLRATDITNGIPDDYLAGTGTTGRVTVGGSATGKIDFHDDRDWFAVTLEAGRNYLFDLKGLPTGSGTLRDPYLRGIYDAAGNLIPGTTNDDGAGRNSRVEFTPTQAGTYYVSAGAFIDMEGTYTVSVRELTDSVPGDDHPAGTGTAGTVAVGGSVRGTIDFDADRDWFAVTLEAGRIYRFDMEGLWTRKGDLADPYIQGIHDTDGVMIPGTTDNNGGELYNSRVTFVATADGTHYVSLRDGGHGPWRVGTYTLSVSDLTAEDPHTAGTDTTGTLVVGGSAAADILFHGDLDWFAVTLEAGRTYRFDMEGQATDAGTLLDPYLRGIYDDNGTLIPGTTANNGGVSFNSRLDFTVEDAGTYYVSAGSIHHQNNEDGTYRLSATDITDGVPDDYTDGTGTAGRVEVGGSATGEIEFLNDRDWFAVTLEAGRTYRFDMNGSEADAGTLYSPFLRGIHDSNGNLIAGTVEDSSDFTRSSQVRFTAAADGIHYVSAGAWSYTEGTYTLSVAEVM